MSRKIIVAWAEEPVDAPTEPCRFKHDIETCPMEGCECLAAMHTAWLKTLEPAHARWRRTLKIQGRGPYAERRSC